MEKEYSKCTLQAGKDLYDLISNPEILSLCDLDKKEKMILRMRLREGINLEDIGRSFNLSGERIRQIYGRAIARVRKRLVALCLEFKTIALLKKENELLNRQLTGPLPFGYKKDVGNTDILRSTVDILQLDTRTSNVLSMRGINTVEELLQWSEERLLKFHKLGEVSINRLKDALARYNLSLAGF